MGWFERQAGGRPEAEVSREHARYLRAAGVDRALELLAGPYGVRRFVIFFERQGGVVRVTRLVAVPLAWGGGPPPTEGVLGGVAASERALTRLHRNMALGPRWDRGAIGYVRDVEGRAHLFPLFDDDADRADLEKLPIPGPPGHPLEAPAYRRLLAGWERRMHDLQVRTNQVAHDWEDWEIDEEGTLALHYADGTTRRHRSVVLFTYLSSRARLMWQTEQPLFAEDVFACGTFQASWEAAMEVGLLTAARLGAAWLFAQPTEDEGVVVVAAVFE